MLRFSGMVLICAFAVLPLSAQPTCVNKFLSRSDSGRQIITLLTGKLTFQEAKALAAAIAARQSPPLEWVSDEGKPIAKQWGELKVVRPMPVGCDDKKSGVIMIATFPTHNRPLRKMFVKLDAGRTVTFDQQSQ